MTTTPQTLSIDESAHETRLPAEQYSASAANAARFVELPLPDSSEPPELQIVAMRGYN